MFLLFKPVKETTLLFMEAMLAKQKEGAGGDIAHKAACLFCFVDF